ncbi:DNA-binding transcriptional regulator, AcrR family [Sinosporangium album]|uniref:DNA-binding transcriptional regulator, AcrR family n=1 Tax=Sinosporangium album TaxID=504805 RepID=A0A1G8HJW7_9ACTN|nr:TetR/AcrR family transcriptional regulator [Sinosporangium album]SDI06740.1 DNA-binding transcriptional regulator, AcrR family [Sinosporangium album]
MGATREQPGRRATTKARNRRRLLDAAADHLAQHGTTGSLLEDIAAQADLTKGAIYSIFKSKNGLLAAVMADLVEQGADAFQPPTPHSAADDRDLATALRDYGQQYGTALGSHMSRATLLLELELALYAFRSEELTREFAPRAQTRTDALAAALTGRRRPDGTPCTPEHAHAIAVAVISALQGLAQHGALTTLPVPLDLFADVAAALATLPESP